LKCEKKWKPRKILIPGHALFPAQLYLRNMDGMGILFSLFFILQ